MGNSNSHTSVHADWKEVAPGVWKLRTGAPSEVTPASIVSPAANVEALTQMGVGSLPFRLDEIGVRADKVRTVVTLPLQREERLYGMGLQFMRMNHRGRTRFLRVNSDPKQDTGETHAPVPWYVSDLGYGVFVNTSRIATFYCGSSVRTDSNLHHEAKDRNRDSSWKATPLSDTVEVVVPEPGVELYVFAGPTMLEAVRRYNLFHGGGFLPPKWGLGFWHRVPKSYTADEVLAEALEFRSRGVPCDVIGLEPGWHSRSYPVTYEWDRDKFPDPERFVRGMEEHGFRVNLWEHPYVSPDAEIYGPLKPLSGSHTVWHGLVPDYTLPEARQIYTGQHQTEHVDIGVSGYKLDECDGSELTRNSWIFPQHAEFPSGCDGEQMRQVYGLSLQKMTADLFRSADRRTYGLARASNACASTLPYVLYSDLYDHRSFVRAMCNASFSGLLWTPEVRKADNAEDWVRRMQVVCLSPLAMLNAWADGTKPWSFAEVEPIVTKYIRLRMRLIPYLYSAFARYYEEGIPPVRAMPLEEAMAGGQEKDGSRLDSTEFAYGSAAESELDDQYMFGDSMLVAPLFAGQRSRRIYLPEGVWYDFDTGERHEGGCYIEVSPGLEIIPVYVRDGSILPLMPELSHAPGPGEQVPIELHHYGTASGACRLYDDDGVSFAYEQGEYRWREVALRVDQEGRSEASVSPVEEGWSSAYSDFTWVFHHLE
ncbi:TIM-barrel domain-containing protein [Paenibacillus sp. J2TS4]|uniref:glycoside hydrolase family 31 protein n=1 Tax=Paenibacillus sp. J2TS4 TaxID=2807194 RepID=UPI001B1DA13D|nr:TIM-barrel domain-containing protein [Paenibacillus sp. J2TS4]GIP36182.1 glycosyl hydrolase family 31 [Paenibacillus sp. J2TS4]